MKACAVRIIPAMRLLALWCAALALGGCQTSPPTAPPLPSIASSPSALTLSQPIARCGKERWDVKVLTDSDASQIDFSKAQPDTVEHLTRLPAPIRPNARIPTIEMTYFEVHALLVGYKLEGDQDYHLGIASPKNPRVTMIAEVPSPQCAATAVDAAIYKAIRQKIDEAFGPATSKFKRLKTPAKVTIRGVGFYDHLHNQTMVAPNGIELHPVGLFVIE